MKKILLVVLLACFIMSIPSTVKAQHEEGKMHFDLYHGLPPHTGLLFRTLVQEIEDGVDAESKESSTIGNIGFRFQYYIIPTFAMGIDANYTKRDLVVSYLDVGSNALYTDQIQQTVTRVMVRTSWEFLEKNGFQVNWANSIGYRSAIWSASSTDPAYVTPSQTARGVIPLAFRTALGMRYMFTDNIGVNLEIGVGGGALANGGLTIAL
jgi:hypothetical protein